LFSRVAIDEVFFFEPPLVTPLSSGLCYKGDVERLFPILDGQGELGSLPSLFPHAFLSSVVFPPGPFLLPPWSYSEIMHLAPVPFRLRRYPVVLYSYLGAVFEHASCPLHGASVRCLFLLPSLFLKPAFSLPLPFPSPPSPTSRGPLVDAAAVTMVALLVCPCNVFCDSRSLDLFLVCRLALFLFHVLTLLRGVHFSLRRRSIVLLYDTLPFFLFLPLLFPALILFPSPGGFFL